MDELIADRLFALFHRDIGAAQGPLGGARLEIAYQRESGSAYTVTDAVIRDDSAALHDARWIDKQRHDHGMRIDRGAALEKLVFHLQRLRDVVLFIVIVELNLAQAGWLGQAGHKLIKRRKWLPRRATVRATRDFANLCIGHLSDGLPEVDIPDGIDGFDPFLTKRGMNRKAKAEKGKQGLFTHLDVTSGNDRPGRPGCQRNPHIPHRSVRLGQSLGSADRRRHWRHPCR